MYRSFDIPEQTEELITFIRKTNPGIHFTHENAQDCQACKDENHKSCYWNPLEEWWNTCGATPVVACYEQGTGCMPRCAEHDQEPYPNSPYTRIAIGAQPDLDHAPDFDPDSYPEYEEVLPID